MFHAHLRYGATVTKPVMRRDVLGGGAQQASRSRVRKRKDKTQVSKTQTGSGEEDGGCLLITKPTASGMD
jgi:hypothetical protein